MFISDTFKTYTYQLSLVVTAVVVAWIALWAIDWLDEKLSPRELSSAEIPEYLQLRSAPEDVLFAEAYETEAGEELRYAYASGLVPYEEGEDGRRRTPSSRSFVLAEYENEEGEPMEQVKTVFSSEPQFYKDGDEWRQIEYATTTPEVFAASGAIKYVQRREWWERLMPGKPLFAQTSTFRPDANPESNSVDGAISSNETNNSTSLFSACLTAVSSGTRSAGDTAVNLFARVIYTSTDNPPLFDNFGEDRFDCQVFRAFLTFDTTSLPDSATVDSAVLSVYGISASGINDVGVKTANPSSPTSIATGDWTTVGTSFISTTIDTVSFSTSAYNDFTFNASGRSHVNLTGVTEVAVVLQVESGTFGSGNEGVTFSSADTSGTSQDPELEVTYTAGVDFSFGQWFPF